MQDNKTSQPAHKYDANINKTIPFYSGILEQTIDLIKVVKAQPANWLDTGCGTGNLIEKATPEFLNCRFVLADPSDEMLKISRRKLYGTKISDIEYIQAGSEDLTCSNNEFDVITAILSHHYLDKMRNKASQNCFRMLKTGGVYVTVETIRPQSDNGLSIGLERWRSAQLKQGKSPEEVNKHLSRYGVEIFPITIESHLKLLKEIGFTAVEVFWVSVMQAGFYAIK
ncbi:class I SAM-dependent methyltransferase [Dehalobacter sp. DCM]|uniref:class I SAM-dependent methyltransferase n=1 Tax=Dehalobacter sp. DCM TaxID=2907827 RepID=UPI003081DBC2|nr:class I SAM-dependent methyltransferase [Dehalobacter sp. DCM]